MRKCIIPILDTHAVINKIINQVNKIENQLHFNLEYGDFDFKTNRQICGRYHLVETAHCKREYIMRNYNEPAPGTRLDKRFMRVFGARITSADMCEFFKTTSSSASLAS